ncbi:FtsX-like permease family protein [Micromonospora sp. NPDC049366]|uniref:FtsX-like permease family protein n=1 Tax=Micromonospora sp. NPDC049366 TaxID=3364271 RepID=UPI0037A91E93
MLAVIAGALVARRAQALAVLLLAVLAGTAAAAAPLYVSAAGQALARQELAAAPSDQQRLRISSIAEHVGLPDDPGAAAFQGLLTPFAAAGFDVVLGAQAGGVTTGPAGRTVNSSLVFRQGVCERVTVVGACPRDTDAGERPEVMVSANTAAHLGVSAGSEVTFAGVPLRVSGVYRPLDPSEPYWLGDELLRPPAPGPAPTAAVGSAEDAIFTAAASRLADEDAVLQRPLADVFVTDELVGTGSAEEIEAAIAIATSSAAQVRFGTGSGLPQLLDRVAAQRDQLESGVALGAGLLVLLCWLVLFVAVGSAADERRPEQGLLLLRGVQRRRLWALALGESAVPALVAIPLGALAGLAAAELLAARTLTGDTRLALGGAAFAYATIAAAGALAAVLLAQTRTLSAPVVDLLRRVPARVRGWRTSLGDVAAVSAAVAAMTQLRAGGSPSGLALLAPVVAALAVGVLLARFALLCSAAVGAALLARGRIRAGLALLQVGRQPRFRPLIALLTVAVAMLAFTAGVRERATAAYADRAVVDVGAPRVIGVDALSRGHLLAAVRAVDPEGRYAMAAVTTSGGEAKTSVLAVDSPRLATVAASHPAYGVAPAEMARPLRPAPPAESILLRGSEFAVTVDADFDESAFAGHAPRLHLLVAGPTGTRQVGVDRPLASGRGDYRVPLPECVPQCRLVRFEVSAQVTPGPLRIRLEQVRSADGTVQLSGADLADMSRWRQPGRTVDYWFDSAVGGGPALLLDVPDGRRTAPIPIAVADAPDPLPAWLTRSWGTQHGSFHYDGIDGAPTNALVAGFVDRLPRLGGSGLLVDLEYADRLAVAGQAGVKEVWLGAAAPDDVLDRLRAQGVAVRYDRTISAEREELLSQAPALALAFNLVAALAGVLIGAAGLVTTAAAEQRSRVATLVALRWQGLPVRAVRGGYGWPVAFATVAGALATVAIWLLARDGQRLFADGRSPVPVPAWPEVGPLLAVTVPAVAVFAVTAVLLGWALTAAVRSRSTR